MARQARPEKRGQRGKRKTSRQRQKGARRQKSTERACDELRRRILDNRMPPGGQYLEQELATDLGMSRTPVREALIRLAEEGLVELRARHGARVLAISTEDLREVYEILAVLEAQAALRVAGRRLSEAELAPLDAAAAEMEVALSGDHLDVWAAADERFHKTVVALAGNRRLEAIVTALWRQIHRARMQTLDLRPKPHASNAEHRALIGALRDGDGARAWSIHHDHRTRNAALLLDLLRSLGLSDL